jgi:hypothetical protein
MNCISAKFKNCWSSKNAIEKIVHGVEEHISNKHRR